MTTQTVDGLADDYLRRLSQAASWLPADRREELVDGIAEHLTEARAEGVDVPGLREVLDRLGTPEDLVRAAASEAGLPPYPYPVLVPRRSLAREYWACGLMSLGSFVVPVAAWIAGAVLQIGSPRWKTWEKVFGFLLVPLGPWGLFLVAGFAFGSSHSGDTHCVSTESSESCTTTGDSILLPSAADLFLVGLVLPCVVQGLLLLRATRRAAAEPAYAPLV